MRKEEDGRTGRQQHKEMSGGNCWCRDVVSPRLLLLLYLVLLSLSFLVDS